MHFLVTYDVNTLTPQGKSRLRRVARVCLDFGQRVQFSVFEVSVNATQEERMKKRLLNIIDEREDSLRIYHLRGTREEIIESYGRDQYTDFTGLLTS